MEITFDFLMRYSNKCFYSERSSQARSLRFVLEEINKVIDVNEIKVIYPMNLFIDDKQIEIYLFNDKRNIMKVTYENKELNAYLYFFKDIVNFKSKINCENKSRSLSIDFSNGEKIEFNSINDTNSYYTNEFDELIIGIWKLFITNKIPTEE